jgi:hypothetical protein
MSTFFTTPKPFEGHSRIIQGNALKSRNVLHPGIEAVLFDAQPGTAEVCREIGLQHEPRVEADESSLKYVDHLVLSARELARRPCLRYSNCEMVFTNDFRDRFEMGSAKMPVSSRGFPVGYGREEAFGLWQRLLGTGIA